MTNRVYIRVTVDETGKGIKREMMHDGEVVCELSSIDLIELVMQATSSLRYDRVK